MKKLMILAAVCLLSAMNSMAQDQLFINNFSITAGGDKQSVSINLTNSTAYSAFQFDLTLPTGMSIALNKKGKLDVTLNEDRMEDHTMTVEKLDNGDYRFVAFSLSNAPFYETSGELVKIKVEAASDMAGGEVSGKLHSINFTEPNETGHTLSDAAFTVTVSGGTGINEIEMSNDKPATIYDLKGNIIRKNATSTEGLSKGVYIIDNKKVIVKYFF